MKTVLNMDNIVKTYIMGEEEQVVLNNVNFKVNEGEFVSVLGPSGSGKSTLMNIIGCLDAPTSGRYILNDNDVDGLGEVELSEVRKKEIGFVFQQFQLLPRLSALENVELPLIYSNVSTKERKALAKEMLEKVGLGDKLKNRPNQLSGGQQQRVAIARALVTQPTILLADEPTGALDQKTGKQIMELFAKIHNEGKTIVMITHDKKIAQHGSRIVNILDGKLCDLSVNDVSLDEPHTQNTAEESLDENVNNISVLRKDVEFSTISINDIPQHPVENNVQNSLNQLVNAFSAFLQDEKNAETTSNILKQLSDNMKPTETMNKGGHSDV